MTISEKRAACHMVSPELVRPSCPCGWHFPFVTATGAGIGSVKGLTLHVKCPDCGQTFGTDKTQRVGPEAGDA